MRTDTVKNENGFMFRCGLMVQGKDAAVDEPGIG